MQKMSYKTVLDQLPRVETEWIRPLDPRSYRLSSFIFLRFLGLIYTPAFLSLTNQLSPLLGSDGLLPAPLFYRKSTRLNSPHSKTSFAVFRF